MSGRISAGSTLPDAFIAAARRASDPLGAAAHPVEEAVAFGDGFVPSLVRLRPELDDPTSDRVLATLIFAQQSGGQRVGTVISSLGVSISEELRVRRAHSAALTEQRMTATVALVAPWMLLGLTISTNPQAAIAYRTATGSLVIAVGFALTSLGFLIARRSARLSRAPGCCNERLGCPRAGSGPRDDHDCAAIPRLGERVGRYLRPDRSTFVAEDDQPDSRPAAAAGLRWSNSELLARRRRRRRGGAIVGVLLAQGDLFVEGPGRAMLPLAALGAAAGWLLFDMWLSTKREGGRGACASNFRS